MKKSYWIICINYYEVNGCEFTSGLMEYTNSQSFNSKYWRKATKKEIETKRFINGDYVNLGW